MKYTPEELAWLIRRDCIEMTHRSHASHIGSDLSCADILAALYGNVLKVDPTNPDDPSRDYFLMGKGHASAALYSCLANVGFFPRERLETFYQDGSTLSGHVTKHGNPGVELSTGSLGHALGVGVGLAYAFKKDHRPNRVFVLMGDGECQEGSVYEACSEAGRDNLSNLIALVDHNHQQGLCDDDSIVPPGAIEKRFLAFDWEVRNVNGHDVNAIAEATNYADDKPLCIMCETIKGYPVPFMEHNLLWHYRFPHKGEEYDEARRALLRAKPSKLINPYSREDDSL